MSVPKKVREAEERAEEMRKQMYSPESQDTEGQPKGEAPPAPAEKPKPEATPPANSGHGDPDLADKYERLQAAHKALQGKYNAEVPRMAQRIKELETQLGDAQGKTEQAKQEAAKAKGELDKHLESLRNEYGNDIADAVGAVAKQATESVQQIRQEAHAEKVANFWRRVKRAHPTFDQINTSAEFIKWLADPNEATGLSRHQELNEAGNALDADGVIDIVNAFNDRAKGKPRTTAEDLVAPPKTNGQRLPAQKAQYTTDDLKRHHKLRQTGQVRPDQIAEWEAKEREISASLVEQMQQ